MEFGFRKPVYTGQRITCELTLDSVTEREDRYEASAAIVCRRDGGETVLQGSVEGVLWK